MIFQYVITQYRCTIILKTNLLSQRVELDKNGKCANSNLNIMFLKLNFDEMNTCSMYTAKYNRYFILITRVLLHEKSHFIISN